MKTIVNTAPFNPAAQRAVPGRRLQPRGPVFLVCLALLFPSLMSPAFASPLQKNAGSLSADQVQQRLLEILTTLRPTFDQNPSDPSVFLIQAEKARFLRQMGTERESGDVGPSGLGAGSVSGFYPSFVMAYCYWRAAMMSPERSADRKKYFFEVDSALYSTIASDPESNSPRSLPIRSLLHQLYRSPIVLKMLVVSRLRMGVKGADARMLAYLRAIAAQKPDDIPGAALYGVPDAVLKSSKFLRKQVEDAYKLELGNLRFVMAGQPRFADDTLSGGRTIITGRGSANLPVKVIAYDPSKADKSIAEAQVMPDGSFLLDIKGAPDNGSKVALRWEPLDPSIASSVPELKGGDIPMEPLEIAAPARIVLDQAERTVTEQLKTKVSFQVIGFHDGDRVMLAGKEAKQIGPGAAPNSLAYEGEVNLEPDQANPFEIVVERKGAQRYSAKTVITSHTEPRVIVSRLKGAGPDILRVQVSDYVGIQNLLIDGGKPWEGVASTGTETDGRKTEVYLIPWLSPRDTCRVSFDRPDGQPFRRTLPTSPSALAEADDPQATGHAGPVVAALIKNDIESARAELIKVKEQPLAKRALVDIFDRLIVQKLPDKSAEEKRLNDLRPFAILIGKDQAALVDQFLNAIPYSIDIKKSSAVRVAGPVTWVHLDLSGYRPDKHRITGIDAGGVSMIRDLYEEGFMKLVAPGADSTQVDFLVALPPGVSALDVKLSYKSGPATNVVPANPPVDPGPGKVPGSLNDDLQQIMADRTDSKTPWIVKAWHDRTALDAAAEEAKAASGSGADAVEALTALSRSEELYERLTDSADALKKIESHREEILATIKPEIENAFESPPGIRAENQGEDKQPTLYANQGKIAGKASLRIKTRAKSVKVTIGNDPAEEVPVVQGLATVNLLGRAAVARKPFEVKVQVAGDIPGARSDFLHKEETLSVKSLSEPRLLSSVLSDDSYEVPSLKIDRATGKFGSGDVRFTLQNAKRAEYRIRANGMQGAWTEKEVGSTGAISAPIKKGDCEPGGTYEVDVRAWETEDTKADPVDLETFKIKMPQRCIAFVLGIDTFQKGNYPPLTYPSADAREIIRRLKEDFHYEPANIIYVLGYEKDKRPYFATDKTPEQLGFAGQDVFGEAITRLKERASLLAPFHGFVFLASHGIRTTVGDTPSNRLVLGDGEDVYLQKVADTIVEQQDKMFQEFPNSRPVTFELVDACRNGSQVAGSPDSFEKKKAQLVPIFSCRRDQEANENLDVGKYPDLALKEGTMPIKHGFFTFSVLKALDDLAGQDVITTTKFVDAAGKRLGDLIQQAKSAWAGQNIHWNDQQSLLPGADYPPPTKNLPVFYKPGVEQSMGFAPKGFAWSGSLFDFLIAAR